MIIIQHIRSTWTKQSRGMPGAAKRNAVPKQLCFDSSPSPKCEIYIQKTEFHERMGFQPETTFKNIINSNKYWTFEFEVLEKSVLVHFQFDLHEHGQPKRERFMTKFFELGEHETGQYQINGRYSYYAGQWYEQHVINLANISKFDPKIFLEKEFDHKVNKLADLF